MTTDAETVALAQLCIRSFLKGDLADAPFSLLMRLGLKKTLSQRGGVQAHAVEEVVWGSFEMRARGTFPGLQAFVFGASVRNGDSLEALIGVDGSSRVVDFALIWYPKEFERESRSYYSAPSPFGRLAGHSESVKVAAIMPFAYDGSSLSGNRRTKEHVVFSVKVKAEDWKSLSTADQQSILHNLEPVALHYYWLSFHAAEDKRRLRIVIVKSHDRSEGGIYTSSTRLGDPESQDLLADRFVDIPS